MVSSDPAVKHSDAYSGVCPGFRRVREKAGVLYDVVGAQLVRGGAGQL